MKKTNLLNALRYLPYDIVKYLLGLPGLLWFRPHILYESPAAKKRVRGGAIAISNHNGFHDPVYLQYAIWYRRHHFVCLQKLLDGKLGFLFRFFLCIPIDKENVNINTFHSIVDHLNREELVSMFPEGKVNDGSGNMAVFKSGVVLMALKSKKPIIPVYIEQKKHWYSRLSVIIGEPILTDEGVRTFRSIDETTAMIEEKEKKLKTILEERLCRQAEK